MSSSGAYRNLRAMRTLAVRAAWVVQNSFSTFRCAIQELPSHVGPHLADKLSPDVVAKGFGNAGDCLTHHAPRQRLNSPGLTPLLTDAARRTVQPAAGLNRVQPEAQDRLA